MAADSFTTYRISHIGGGIPSLDVARSIAEDVFSYGLWGQGYPATEELLGLRVPRLRVILETIDENGALHTLAWVEGWHAPAGVISAETRCGECRRAGRTDG